MLCLDVTVVVAREVLFMTQQVGVLVKRACIQE